MDLQTEDFVGTCRHMHCVYMCIYIHIHIHVYTYVSVLTTHRSLLLIIVPLKKSVPHSQPFVGFGWFGATQFNSGLAKKQLAGFFSLLTVSFFVSSYSRIKAES